MKITEIEKIIEGQKLKRKSAEEKIQAIEQRIEEYKAQSAEAAAAGDVELFKSLAAKKAEAETDLLVMRQYLAGLKIGVSSKEAEDAWASFTAEYNREFERRYKAFEKVKADFLAKYNEMVIAQNEALGILKRLHKCCGDAGIDNKGYLKVLPDVQPDIDQNMRGCDPDMRYYAFYLDSIDSGYMALDIVHQKKFAGDFKPVIGKK